MIEITESEFKKLSDYIRANYGIFLKEEKQSLLNARLATVIEQNHFTNFSEYYDYIVADATGYATSVLIDRVTTNYTYFMREPEHFRFMTESALPYFEQVIPDHGCSTGEEPYTVAIILEEYFKMKRQWDKKLLATDISNNVLERARAGVYDAKQLELLPPVWKLSYFTRTGESYAVKENIKKEVIFQKQNLVQNFKFQFKRKFHMIFCRNVMIYFDKRTRDALVNNFYEITEPGGYLFIGHTESLDRETTKYKFIAPAIYRKM